MISGLSVPHAIVGLVEEVVVWGGCDSGRKRQMEL